MIDRGSGRTSGLTDWQLMDVLSMWACVQDHETQGHWKQVAGWRKVCDLAMNHLRRLHEYRRGLAEAWPPETNAAARAYLGELDQLIDRVQHTHDAAAANHDALAAATRAIDSARPELKNLYEQYSTKLQQKRSYEATLADPKAAAGSRVVDPPVTDVELEQLNTKARGIMYGLSSELQQAQVMLRQPPPRPKPSPGVDQNNPDIYASNLSAPVIPPIVPVPISPSTPVSRITRAENPVRAVPAPTAPNSGPLLGGAGTGLAPTPASPAAHGMTPSTTQGMTPNVGLPPSLPPLPGTPGRNGLPNPLRGQPGPAGRSGISGGNSSLARPMPPGGMIGGTPGMALGQPGGTTPPRRINPLGGVIGGGGAGTAPSGAAGSRPGGARANHVGSALGLSPMGGAPGMASGPGAGTSMGRPSRRETVEGESRRWDPDHPWETDEGVDPIVRPPEDGPIDPGPAIGFGR
nr:hypothetical protein [Micromonospora purpureochromogenes]